MPVIDKQSYSEGLLAGANSTPKQRDYSQGVIDGHKAKSMAIEAQKLVDSGQFDREADAIRYLYKR